MVAMERSEMPMKLRKKIKEAEKLAIETGRNPDWLCSSLCPKCGLPLYREINALVCLKCKTRY